MNFNRIFIFVLLFSSTSVFARAIPNVVFEDFKKTEYVGKWALHLNSEPQNDTNPAYVRYRRTLERLYMGEDEDQPVTLKKLGIDPRDRLFTTTTVIGEDPETHFPITSTIPDLLYPVKEGTGGKVFGLRLVAVPDGRDQDGNRINTTRRIDQTKYLNPFLTKLFYGRRQAQNRREDKSLYVVVPHSDSNQFLYSNFSEMAQQKVEVSTGHASAYAYIGGLGATSRRAFLQEDGLGLSTLNNLYAISVKGVDQEALNLNLSLWSMLYYNNPDGYNFSEDYHFDWVVNVNPREVLAFARGWLDQDWVRKDLNQKIREKLADPEIAAKYRRVLEMRGDDKPEPFNSETTAYSTLLKNHYALALYCFEGVATTNFLGLNVPLTPAYLKKMFGTAAGEKMFRTADEKWKQIQANLLEVEVTDPNVVSLSDERFQSVLAKMKPLWEKSRADNGFTSFAKFNPESPLFPDRDATGNAVGIDQSLTAAELSQRDLELDELGRSLPFKPQTTADILRALIEMYAPFHKVGAVRDTALILNFVDKIKERTGLLFDQESQEYGFANRAVKILFKHEANLVWAKLNSLPSKAQIRTAILAERPVLDGDDLAQAIEAAIQEKYDGYVQKTNKALDEMLVVAKNPEGRLSANEERSFRNLHRAGFSQDEIEAALANVREFRATRNARLYNRARELKNTIVAETLRAVPITPLRDYPLEGVAAYALMDAEISPVLEQANDLPIKNPDLVLQILVGDKYVKYNYPPGLVQTVAQGVHASAPNVRYTPVATMIGESMLSVVNAPDPHEAVLQSFFRENAAAEAQ